MLYLLATILILLIFTVTAIHFGFRAPKLPNTTSPDQVGLSFEETTFTSAKGTQLKGWWLPCKEASETTVIIVHGWGANKGLMLPLATPLLASEVNVLLYDARNHGDSDKQGISSMPKFAEDLTSAVTFVKQHYPEHSHHLIALGHSVGAAAVLLAASRKIELSGVIALSSFAHPEMVIQRHLAKLKPVPGLINAISVYVQWAIGHKFDEIAPVHTVKEIPFPLLLIHGQDDEVIPVEDQRLICTFADHNLIQCAEIENAGHYSIEAIEKHFSLIEQFLHSVNNRSETIA